MYVAARGGERAIAAAHAQLASLAEPRSGTERLHAEQIEDQLGFLVARVMAEGSVYDRSLAARAILQAQGDVNEAIFLIRAFRATVSRFGVTDPIDTEQMRVARRVSAVFKDVPGGQILGPTFDYSHRLIDFDGTAWTDEGTAWADATDTGGSSQPCETDDPQAVRSGSIRVLPRVLETLNVEGIIERVEVGERSEPADDLTRTPLGFPAGRGLRLQAMARGDEGFLLAMGYSTQRGFGSTHPFAGEIRVGEVPVTFRPPELDFDICIGEVELTECEMINQFVGNDIAPPQFTRGYGLVFAQNERKAMSMALVDRAMRAQELDELAGRPMPAQDIEFVISHCDTLEASGFVQHLKLPHYVDFQSELVLLRQLRQDHASTRWDAPPCEASYDEPVLPDPETSAADASGLHSELIVEVTV